MSFNYEEQKSQHEREQTQAWKSFLHELDHLQVEYRATKTEIIEGLHVTRSKFYAFEKNPESERLNIDRSNILNLWAYLCDTENRKIPKNAKAQREQLREAGPDRLLMSLGFAAQKEVDSRGSAIADPQIKRVISRLESNWIYDGAVRVYITNKILDQILDLGRPDYAMHAKTVPLDQVEEWPEGDTLKSRNSRVNQKYKRSVQKLIRTGKTEFVESELFELYQSILEHDQLGLGGNAKLEVIDCQFRALSQDINKLLGTDKEPEAQSASAQQSCTSISFKDISERAERKLIDLLIEKGSDYSDMEERITDIASTPCLEAKIRCRIRTQEKIDVVTIRYSSTSTHVENMLRAMSRGLGYPLGVSGFSIRATGRTEKSLARISIALSKLNESVETTPAAHAVQERIDSVYEGWWVTSNTIIGILNATSDAVTRWLYQEGIEANKYYEACERAAELSETFHNLRKALYEQTPDAENSKKLDFQEQAQTLIDATKKYCDDYAYDRDDDGFKIHIKKMEDQTDMCFLALVHSALIAGNPSEAEEMLDRIGGDLKGTEKHLYSYVRSVYGEACKMSHRLVSGDEAFLIGKQWKLRDYSLVSESLDELGKYIRHVKNIDFDIYLVVSQLFGIIGILDFYSSPDLNDSDMSGYTKSTDFLLEAAHYSLRIGHVRRASQWLSFASRMCTRLGSIPQAKKLYQLAVNISGNNSSLADQLSPLQYAHLGSNWSGVSHFLALGEIRLSEQKDNGALDSFLKAFDITLRLSYGRVIPDCLYNIARASRALTGSDESQLFTGINPFEKWNGDEIEAWKEKAKNPNLANLVTPIIERHLTAKTGQELDLIQLADEAQSTAAEIWNHWHTGAREHPYAEEVKAGTFLQQLSKQ